VAEVCKQAGCLTIGVVTKPFGFEGAHRMRNAEQGIAQLIEKVDTLIIVPNERLLSICDQKTTIDNAFKMADEALRQGVKAISELITVPGIINLDFADIKSVMLNAGTALMGVGTAEGDGRASTATRAAIQSPLLEFSITGAKGVIFNIIGGKDLSITEVEEAAKVIQDEVHQDCNLVFGASIDPELGDEVKVTVIATGFGSDEFFSHEDPPVAEPAEHLPQRTPVMAPNSPAGQRPGSVQAPSRPSIFGGKPKQAYQQEVEELEPEPKAASGKSSDYDDDDDLENTPAFLRRKKSF
jgi:cell division protein FtsZ